MAVDPDHQALAFLRGYQLGLTGAQEPPRADDPEPQLIEYHHALRDGWQAGLRSLMYGLPVRDLEALIAATDPGRVRAWARDIADELLEAELRTAADR